MDFLKAEIASKRKTLDSVSTGDAEPAKKYVRKGDLERMRKEEEEQSLRVFSPSFVYTG